MNPIPYNEQRGDSIEDIIFDKRPLPDQFFHPESLPSFDDVAEELETSTIQDPASLAAFLQQYKENLLIPVELPAILQAYLHASQNEVRELIAYDQSLMQNPPYRFLASASIRTGRSRLQRLRPLKDQRFVRRYINAVDEGLAHGWHSLVFGISLALYSVPVRQGMIGYARMTLGGFIQAAPYNARFSSTENQRLLDGLLQSLPGEIEQSMKDRLPAVSDPNFVGPK